MGTQISRRNVARATLWTAPAVVAAAAAPAVAASCTPKTVNVTTSARWVSTQTDFSNDNGDPEFHTVQYTFTATGPDAIPPGLTMKIAVTMTVLQGEEATGEVASSSSNVSAAVSNSSTSDDEAGSTTTVSTFTVTAAQAIAVNETFTVIVRATYGALAGDNPTESVTVESPQTTTETATCTTTITAATVNGSSDGTSYTSPG